MTVLTKQSIKRLEDMYVSGGNEAIKLMETAGDSIARFVFDKIGIDGKAIAVVCGHGNNGGDGFVAARKFLENGGNVCIILADGQPTTNDAIDMLGRSERAGVKVVAASEASANEVRRYIMDADIVVDAIFGIGYRPVDTDEELTAILEAISMTAATVIAADIPSGVCADSGEVGRNCVKADYTVTFTALKPGHVVYPGAEYCGTVITVPVGIDEDEVELEHSKIATVDYQSVRLCFQPRRDNTHKGSYGTLLSICGSRGMAGAAVFAGKAAVQSGVGLVRAVLPAEIYPIVSAHLIDPVYVPLEANSSGTLSGECTDTIAGLIEASTAVLIGCGLGCNSDTEGIVRRVLEESAKPVVIDADGLNAISNDPYCLQNAHCPIIITPHPGEMARLIHADTADVQRKRLEMATDFAQEFGVTVVLKGAHTIIAAPNGTIRINLTGNPGMAKGGSGDVLAGIIASLCAQGMSVHEAALCGVHIHGMAGDRAAARFSQHSMTPTDIIFDLPTVFQEIER